jgi:hypothetical protein
MTVSKNRFGSRYGTKVDDFLEVYIANLYEFVEGLFSPLILL